MFVEVLSARPPCCNIFRKTIIGFLLEFIYFEAVVVTVTAYFHFESEIPKKNVQKYHETFQLSQITLSVAYVIYCSLQTIVSLIGTIIRCNEALIGYIRYFVKYEYYTLVGKTVE